MLVTMSHIYLHMQGVLAVNQGHEHKSPDSIKALPLQDQARAIYIQVI